MSTRKWILLKVRRNNFRLNFYAINFDRNLLIYFLQCNALLLATPESRERSDVEEILVVPGINIIARSDPKSDQATMEHSSNMVKTGAVADAVNQICHIGFVIDARQISVPSHRLR